MSKTYRHWDPDQSYLLPPSPSDWLPEDELVCFVLDTVRGSRLQGDHAEVRERRWPGFSTV